MDPYTNLRGGQVKFHEGWLRYKSNDGRWVPYWCVMRDNVFYLFSNDANGSLKHIGNLTMDHKSKVEYKGGDSRSGFRFELHTPRRVSNFKAEKSCEREIWRAYIVGIVKGRIPDNVDLLPGQIQEVQERLEQYFSNLQRSATHSIPPKSPRERSNSVPAVSPLHESSRNSLNSFDSPDSSDSGFYPKRPMMGPDYYLVPSVPGPPPWSTQDRSPSGGSGGSFTSDHEPPGPSSPFRASGENPSWYFPDCDRPLSEQILRLGAIYGNTLMRSRPGLEAKPGCGKEQVISKRIDTDGEPIFSHFKVNADANGYKIEVENPHEPMGSLPEVMQFFVETSGRHVTCPMTCNDLSKLGLAADPQNPYNTSILPETRYPHTTKETSRRNHPNVMKYPFPPTVPSADGASPVGASANNDFPPPPPPPPLPPPDSQDQASQPPNQFAPPPPPPHTSAFKVPQSAGQEQRRGLFGRTNSEPCIPQDIVAQVQNFRQQHLKELKAPPKKMPLKCKSVDTESPPPLPPNHPTANKKELHETITAVKSNSSQPNKNTQQANLSSPVGPETTKKSQVVGGQTVLEKEQNSPKSIAKTNSVDHASDELAAAFAKVTGQSLPKKEPPATKPKPAVLPKTKSIPEEESTNEEVGAAASETPVASISQNLATESFKKRLSNLFGSSEVGGPQEHTRQNAAPSTTPTLPTNVQPGRETSHSGDYENLEPYQNVAEIRYLKK